MALGLKCKGSMSSDGTKIYFQDNTGNYSATNLTGWGSPNPATTTVTSFQIVFDWSAGTPVTYNFTVSSGTVTAATMVVGSTTYNIFSALTSTTFPFTSANLFELTSVFGTAATLPSVEDGQYTITYKIIGINSGTAYNYTTSTTFFVDCSLRCCVQELRLTADPNNENDEVMCRVNAIEYWWKSALCAVEVGKPNEIALQYFTKAQEICSGDCGCGCD